MDRRTKTLVAAFGLLICYGIVSGVVYPNWIEPQLSIDKRIAEKQVELDRLESTDKKVTEAKSAYRSFVQRVGSVDAGRVENDLRTRLNQLIERNGLQNANVSGGRSTRDPKTEVERMFITVTAVATLQSAVKFLKDVAELPHLIRITSPKIDPAVSSRKERDTDRVNIAVPLEVMILPQTQMVGTVALDSNSQPPSKIRHEGRDYAVIWDRKPFQDHIKLLPLRADAKRDLNLTVGAGAVLNGSAAGGDGNYSFVWTPAEGLSGDKTASPTVDTSTVGSRTYTLTVTDGKGNSATDSVIVTVQEAVAEVPYQPPPPPTPGPPPVVRWQDNRSMQLAMAISTNDGTGRKGQVLVYNNKSKRTDSYKIGEPFDGGELVFVHHRGGVVRTNDEYSIYPIGASLDQAMRDQDAVDYPDLQQVAQRLHAEREAAKAAAAQAAENKASGEPSVGGAVAPEVIYGPVEDPARAASDRVVSPAALPGPVKPPTDEGAGKTRPAKRPTRPARPAAAGGKNNGGEQSQPPQQPPDGEREKRPSE